MTSGSSADAPGGAAVRSRHGQPTGITHAEAVRQLGEALGGTRRSEILDAVMHRATFSASLKRLRAAMRAHTFPTGHGKVALRELVSGLDQRTRAEGLHVLQGWDPVAHRFPDDITPVLMLDYCSRSGGIRSAVARGALAILLDYYFLSLLSLLTVRAWDAPDPNAALDDVTRLLRTLQGPRGSRCRFVDDAETLLLLAISHYHPEDAAYDTLLRRVWELDERHRVAMAIPGAAILGGHLRWGFQHMYGHDVGRMRGDNVVDYPWLLFSVAMLVRERGRTGLQTEGASSAVSPSFLLNGLTADPWAFTGEVPPAMAEYGAVHEEVRQRLLDERTTLIAAFEEHRPSPTVYSPLGFQFNFLPNAVTALVGTTLAVGSAGPLSLNGLLSPVDAGTAGEAQQIMAGALMRFSGASPDRLGSRGAMLVVYDPFDGVRSFNATMRLLGS